MKTVPDLRSFRGIPRAEAARRLTADGFNEIEQVKPQGPVAMVLSALREPMVLLLLVCAGIYLALGDVREGLIMFTTVFVVGGIEFYQGRKTQRTLEQLRQYSSPRALVVRDGEEMRIAGREVVTGDIVFVREGDRVPADAVVLFELNLGVDESLLTGESHAVAKTEGNDATTMAPPGGEISASLYSGTLIVQGQAVARVTATGDNTQMGRLGKTLAAIPDDKSALQKETGRIVAVFAILAFVLCSAVVVTFAVRYSDWLKGFLAGTALALSMLPEEFPVALTIFLAVGAWRIARKNVMTRVPAALEILGSTEILCSDKTGTITENRMKLVMLADASTDISLDQGAEQADLPETYHETLEYAILASQANPYEPMEKAVLALGNTALAGSEHLHEEWNLFKEYPLSRELLAISRAFKNSQGDYVIAAKGAPEAIFDLCHMQPEDFAKQSRRVTEFAECGLRVIAVAKAFPGKEMLPELQHDFEFQFLGLLGFKDPVRAGVPASVAACAKAGVRVIMITGDHPATAAHIAREINLPDPDRVLTGNMLGEMNAEELKDNIGKTNVFARISPDQKLQIVRALKESAATVIMTGDGVNDAPALKAADIGIAMGGKGTDVAREAAKLVLLDDDFSSIVHAIRLGRRIVANLRKAFSFIVASHIPIAGVALVPVFFPELPVILFPVHIVFLELIIDPACTLAFENEENPKIMDTPLDARGGKFFDLRSMTLSLLQGISVTAAVMAVYFITRRYGYSENASRALTFATLIFCNIFLILSNASNSRFALNPAGFKNPALRWIITAAIVLLGGILYLPAIREIFRFESPDFKSLILCIGCAFSSILWFEIRKYWKHSQSQAMRLSTTV